MKMQNRSFGSSSREVQRSLLQLSVGVAGIVPVAAGTAGILLGPKFVDALVGAGADSHFRYLSGLLLGVGLGFWSTIPRIEANGERFRLLSFIVVAGGVARLISLAVIGLPPIGMQAALAMELGVTPLLCLWQWRVGRRTGHTSPCPNNVSDMRGQ
jgi:Domain of unknown function (DUF4345)